jgi:hypothetical protein
LSVELNELIFFKKLKNEDKTALLNHANSIVKGRNKKLINDLNLNNSDLAEFGKFIKSLNSNNKKALLRLSQSSFPTSSNGETSKILPMTGAISKFKYNVAKDESYCDPLNMLLLGLDSNIVSFSDVLGKVDIKSKTRF